MASDEGTASSKPLLLRGRGQRHPLIREQEEKIPFIEAMVVETGPEREQEGSKIRQRIDY